MQQVTHRLVLDTDKMFWYGENNHFIVNVPSPVFLQEVETIYKEACNRGTVTHTTYVRIAEKVQQLNHWSDTVYCVPRYVPPVLQEVRMDSLTHNIIDDTIVGERGVYFHVLCINE